MALRLLLLIGSALIVAGCANTRAEQAVAAQDLLIGLERTRLLACAGVPERSRVEGDTEFFTYDSEQIVGYGRSYYGGGVFSRGYGRRYGPFALSPGADFSSTYCEATFVLVDGVVEAINYVGASGIGRARYAQCAYIVEACLAQMTGGGADAPSGVGP